MAPGQHTGKRASGNRILGLWRALLLILSPHMLASNAKNLPLGVKLVFGKGRSIWDACFDSEYYRRVHPDVERSGIWPAFHYLLLGYREGRNASTSFDSVSYLARHADVRAMGINPLLHYALFGCVEGRSRAPSEPSLAARLRLPSAAREARRLRMQASAEQAPRRHGEAPLVTVIIPCFNYGKYVEEAIRSVLAQTFTNHEIIVVAAQSTDGITLDVLRELESRALPGTRFVYRTEPTPVGDNRNFGIHLARGYYICCLDADDLIKSTYLETAVFLAEICGYDIVAPSIASFGESDLVWPLIDPSWPAIAVDNQISTVALFQKSAWEQVGGFRDFGKGQKCVPEDWEFWVRMIGSGFRGKSIREPLMRYRVHGGSLSGGCTSSIEYQRAMIREASPQLFTRQYKPPGNAPERPNPNWSEMMEPPSSGQVILIALPLVTIGGAEKLFQTLAERLVRRGYKVLVMTATVIAPALRECTEDFEAITPYVYPMTRLLPEEDCWDDFLRYLLKRHQVGTIVNVGCDFLYSMLREIASEFPEIRVFDQLFNDGVHYTSNRRYAAYLDGTIAPSQVLAGKLISEGGERPEKVSIIAHGITIEEPVAATFGGSGLPADFAGKFLVSFFGRLSIEKAPADFVKIANLLRDNDNIRFLMTGEGSERAAVMALIEHYRLQDRIYAPGFVDNPQTLMALSDVVVLPSTLDGMPLVVFEAQALGKPVVASAVGSLPDVIQDGQTGMLCRPGDVRGFADCILELWRSPELRHEIGRASSVAVRSNHDAESMTNKYVEVFERPRPQGSDSRAIRYNNP